MESREAMEKVPTSPVTAVIPACRRTERLLATLQRIRNCRPAPAEMLVHVDGAAAEVMEAVKAFDPAIRVLTSTELLGPGGSRNRLVREAKHELVANFDDDSFPADSDYFSRVMRLAERFPDSAMFSAASHEKEWRSLQFQRIAVPSGCGCVFRKSWFERTRGFVPLVVAYNMEEVDIGLQLHALGGVIVHDPLLRVVHDHPPDETSSATVNAVVVANTVLFGWLHFPVWMAPVTLWNVLRLAVFQRTRFGASGLGRGWRLLPGLLRQHGGLRKPLATVAILSWLRLKRVPEDLGDARQLSHRAGDERGISSASPVGPASADTIS